MSSNLNSYAIIKDTVSSQNREVSPFINDLPQELISYEDSNNLFTSLNITTGLGNTDKRRSLAKAIGNAAGIALTLGSNGSRRSTNPIYKKVALSGSWTFAANNAIVNGTGGNLLSGDELRANEVVFTSSGLASQVQSVTGNNQFVLYVPYEVSGTSVTLYRMIPVSDYLSQIDLITKGYLSTSLGFSGANLSYYGVVYVNGGVVFLPQSTLTVTGAAGWRYIVVSSLGVVTVETIPISEISADTLQYTPNPVFNSTHNSYMSTVNTSKRIIGIIYFDATNIQDIIPYSTGSKKNDDLWQSNGVGVVTTGLNSRLQFTDPFTYARGTNITCVSNGSGVTDADGFRITFNKNGKAKIRIIFNTTSNTDIVISVNKNSVFLEGLTFTGVSTFQTPYTLDIPVNANDYFTFYISSTTPSSGTFLQKPIITFEEY